MESNPKEMQLQNEEEIDRISELPDPILSIILSYLPTKNAVGTSILSTRWKNLFLSVLPLKLDLDDSLFLNPNTNSNNTHPSTFIKFVDKLFNVTLSDVNYVEEIILHCDNEDYSVKEVASWIRAAVRLNVRHLDLKLKFYLGFGDESTKALFGSLNGCTTLVTLRLWLDEECCFPYNFTLPNLKSLFLTELDVDGKELSRFIACCPALEYLHLFGYKEWYDVYIECPLLKKLVIGACGEETVTDLIIDTPNLEIFMYNGSLAGRYFGCDLKSLHTAHIDVSPSQHQLELEDEGYLLHFVNRPSTIMIVSSCSSTIRLRLSGCTIDGLRRSSLPLPVFHNLIWLSLGCLNWSILARLLQIAPKLEQLTIEEGFQKNEDGFASFKSLLPISPECLVFHVKRIEFRVFEGQANEIKIVEYFLKNGEVLQNLILHCLPSTDMSILTRLLELPKQSKMCQIEYQMKQAMNI